MQALVTGGTGFVGRALVAELRRRGHAVRCAVRTADGNSGTIVVGDLAQPVDWSAALNGIDTVFHLAARVHDPSDDDAAFEAFRAVNVDATAVLAKAAARAGVRRLVFVSSVKAAGETSVRPLSEDDPPQPGDLYGKSKQAAEMALAQAVQDLGSTMAIAIVRPPLVYGPGVGANFRALLRLADSPWPLPLGGAVAPRSFIYVGNLVDALIVAAEHAKPGVEIYHVSDGQDLPVGELVRRLRVALGRPPRLWRVPGRLAATGARLLGRGDLADRLFSPLQVDTGKIQRDLGWRPPFAVDVALRLTAEAYVRARGEEG
jgi:UDP-glucose 4-epimerase